MKRLTFISITVVSIGFCSCEDDDPQIDPEKAPLVEKLNDELSPLSSQDPVAWTDAELKFLDAYGSRAIVGLGEATHGTSEFFKAKHRLLRYFVENHGFKVFAIEADFGESLLINEAVLKGDKSKIVSLMLEKMHFWTWKTNEVRDMLFWMCDYNVGKPDAQKIQYWGVDCQFNTFHPDMIRERLTAGQVPFLSFANSLLDEAETAGANSPRFAGYSEAGFITYRDKLDALTDSLKKYKAQIVSGSSEKQFQLTERLVQVVKQASMVMYHSTKSTHNYRDEYMADNTAWLNEYFNGAGIVLWAHNYHVSDFQAQQTQGFHLREEFNDEYATIGFLFSKGTFRAVTQNGQTFQGLNVQSIQVDPKDGSINELMSLADNPFFSIKVSSLTSDNDWTAAFGKGLSYFHMGATYNNVPDNYYSEFFPELFDEVIYFNTTSAAAAVQ